MYLGKIKSVNSDFTYDAEIPSLKVTETCHAIIQKGVNPMYEVGDLVLITETNRADMVILGYVYGQKEK